MKNKLIFLTVIGTYLTFILLTPLGCAITSEITIQADETEIDEPIKPFESKEISLMVDYKLELNAFTKWFYLNRRIGRMIAFGFFQLYFFKFVKQLPKGNLTFQVDKPDWCQVELDREFLDFEYKDELEGGVIKVTISLNENAPALQNSVIKITGIYSGEGGITETSNSTNISFMPAYVSNISIDAMTNYTVTPQKEIMIPINITNNGNGESIVSVSTFENENWNITPDQDNIVGVDETKKIMIRLTPPKKFTNESITFTFEPTSTKENVDDSYLQGKSVDFSITFYNDGSLEEDDSDIDITSVIIIAFVIIIILIIAFLLLRKRE